MALIKIFDRIDVAKELPALWAFPLFFARPQEIKDTLSAVVVATLKIPGQSLS